MHVHIARTDTDGMAVETAGVKTFGRQIAARLLQERSAAAPKPLGRRAAGTLSRSGWHFVAQSGPRAGPAQATCRTGLWSIAGTSPANCRATLHAVRNHWNSENRKAEPWRARSALTLSR
jgi:hypothetical protein